MRIPLTKYGWPQVAVFPVVILAVMAVCLIAGLRYWPAWGIFASQSLLVVLLIFVLSFFRDPLREVPAEEHLILAPADGTITDIETIEDESYIGGPAVRIGIFLSIFNTHINRAPCNVKVEKITYKKGQYKNAAKAESGRINESNNLNLVRTDNTDDKLIVRQISGAIARHIVCRVKEGEHLKSGEKFGMIKFGSRTELYLPLRENTKTLAKKGDKVKAGLTVLVRYE
ncbi:MAG: phosphatidylserine decarboxylase [Planctomycetota bacterium]|jgi:phosphatidylserine decarboxylase